MPSTRQTICASSEKAGNVRVSNFASSLSLEDHPIEKSGPRLRAAYFAVLDYFVKAASNDGPYSDARLAQYRNALAGDLAVDALTDFNCKQPIKSGIKRSWRQKPTRTQRLYLLFCDIARILLDTQSIDHVQDLFSNQLGRRNKRYIEELNSTLHNDEPIRHIYEVAEDLIEQFRINRAFIAQPEKRILVTANMSAGKSTLVNALVGKVITCMKSEAFTASVHYVYDKPFEDGLSSEWDGVLTLDADHRTLMDYDERNSLGKLYVAAYFSTFVGRSKHRYCFIDTPGVNSATRPEHGRLTQTTLLEERFDKLIYVFAPTSLGTDEEKRHLTFVAENVPKEKVIFVLNKLDNYKQAEDSIKESIERLRKDLVEFGFKNPTICPISAYFALLIKMKHNGVPLNEDEHDFFDLHAKRLTRPEYDLSQYYDSPEQANVSDLTALAARSGLFGLETILYGAKR